MSMATHEHGRITRRLAAGSPALLALYAVTAAFCTYFCMYAFRKPFSAAQFKDLSLLVGVGDREFEIGLKTMLVASQVIGYALAKYLGIKFCSEAEPRWRAPALLGLIASAQAALMLFAVVPDNWKFVPMFFNGLSLGMVWGLVVGYLEGRRTSELLLAGLSCSYIVASGVVKNVGLELMRTYGVSEANMPAAVGAIFFVPYLLSVWMLNQLPPASAEDEAARSIRQSMDGRHRWAFFHTFLFGLVLLLIAYFFLSAYRDFRDNFMVELYEGLGYPNTNENKLLITQTEMIVAFGVMGVLALLNAIRNNQLGLFGAFAVMTSGMLLMGGATWLVQRQTISGFAYMTLVGLGSYMAYVPFGSVLFDRLMASTRVVGTAVFAIYLADAIGYTGSVGVMLVKDIGLPGMTRLEFFQAFTYFMSLLGAALLAGSCAYFLLRKERALAKSSLPVGEGRLLVVESVDDRT